MAYQAILVVDDEPLVVEVVRDYLGRSDFRVLTARNGQVALTLARHERPDSVVLDLLAGWHGSVGRVSQRAPGSDLGRCAYRHAGGPHRGGGMDADGKIVSVGATVVLGEIGAGGSASFDLRIEYEPYSHYQLYAQARQS